MFMILMAYERTFLTSFFSSEANFVGFFIKVRFALVLILILIFLPVTGSTIVFFVTLGINRRRVALSE